MRGSSPPGTVRLTIDERRLVLGVCVVVGAVSVVLATFNYFVTPMLSDLGATHAQSSLLRQVPSTAALLAIFPAGVLGRRFGGRKVILGGGTLFVGGSFLVLVAPVFAVACAGLIVESIGASLILISALGMLSAGTESDEARASAFSTYAIVNPVVYTVVPVLAAVLVEEIGWRAAPALWVVGGLLLLWAARTRLVDDRHDRGRGELVTPLLAGVTLALLVAAVNRVRYDGWADPATLWTFAALSVAMAVVVVRYRTTTDPSLSLGVLRRGGTLLLLAVAIIVPFSNLWFYATMGFQYVFGLSMLTTALVLIPPQLAGIAGAMATRKLLVRRGITFTGVAALGLIAASLTAARTVTVDSPVWLLAVFLLFYSAGSTGAGIAVTNAIMDAAPPGDDGNAAAFRGASSSLGNAIGVAVMSAVVFGAVQASLATQFRAEGLDADRSEAIAMAMRDDATSESVASDYAVPVAEVDQITEAQSVAMVDGFHTFALAATGCTAVAAGVFVVGRRRQERGRAAAAPEAPPPRDTDARPGPVR